MFSIGPVCVCVEGYFLYLRDVSDWLAGCAGAGIGHLGVCGLMQGRVL